MLTAFLSIPIYNRFLPFPSLTQTKTKKNKNLKSQILIPKFSNPNTQWAKSRTSYSAIRPPAPPPQPPPPPSSSASPSPPPSPTSQLRLVFDKFDSNGDGKISSSELAAIFDSLGSPATPDELARMMAEADTDGDGFISLQEFIHLNTEKGDDPSAHLEDLKHAFSVFDADRNGSISAEELARVFRSLGEAVTVAQCKKMIEGVDIDGDGMVSFEEFKVMMSQSGSFRIGS